MEDSTIQALYAEIAKRMSVRDYKPEEFDKETLDTVESGLKSLVSLNASPAKLKIISASESGVSYWKAPYCLASYSDGTEEGQLDAAFLLQEASLYLSTLGYGSCWVGMAKPKAAFMSCDGQPFFKLIVFGKPASKYHRDSVSEFKRKTLSEITYITDCPKIMEAVRLAPSAMNRQGWKIAAVPGSGKLRLYMADNNFIIRKFMDPLTIADAGIALCHLWVAAKALGIFKESYKEKGDIPLKKGCSYIWTMELTENQ